MEYVTLNRLYEERSSVKYDIAHAVFSLGKISTNFQKNRRTSHRLGKIGGRGGEHRGKVAFHSENIADRLAYTNDRNIER